MSRKAKANPKKPPSPHDMDSATLAARAEAELVLSRHKEAIELYKELLKRERRPVWVDGLAACYAGRAHGLAAKGMFQEALVLWRNRRQLCGKPLVEGPYLTWLMQAGERGEAVRLLADSSLPEAARAELETRLAATLLTLPQDTPLPDLPADSALLRHRPAALAALQAYGQGDFAALGECLQAIPFRSPYRDLKPLLKALALLTADPAAAAEVATEVATEVIARLPADGPFERLAAALRCAVLPAGRWLPALRDLDENGRQLVLDLKGCPDPLRPLLLDLAKSGDQPNPGQFFDLLVRHRRALPDGLAANFCRQLLPHAANRLKPHADAFGALPEVERSHLAALAAEARGERGPAMPHWQRMAELLGGNPARRRQAALIWLRLSGIDLAALGEAGALHPEALVCLERSVDLDPDQRDPQLRLIAELRHAGELQQARARLDQALPRFPKDAELLLEAVQVALAGKAFKKAVGLAKQVLELDPINPKVRRLIGQAHFSHARKLIKAKNGPSARKELDAAAEWLRGSEDGATLNLLRALAGDDPASAAIRDAVADLGGALLGGFHLALEAGRLGLDAADLLTRGEVDLAATPAPATVAALARTLEAARDMDKTLRDTTLRNALHPLRPALRRAATGRYAEAEQRLICEAWLRRKESELLRLYADAALKHWPQRPIFVYFKAMAQYADMPYNMPERMRYDLERAADAALAQGDRRTFQRIQDLLHPIESDEFYPEDDVGFVDRLMGNDPGAMFEMLLRMGGEEALFNLARQAMGKREFDTLRKELGGNDKEFARALVEMMAQQAQQEKQAPAPRKPTPRKLTDNQRNLFDD
ncbi:MAG: tetratricopeptide repeat protein [Pseudomonadota bacterium]|nr:tetratricopeptide repeat protein [Pseudomonadota bacterium]